MLPIKMMLKKILLLFAIDLNQMLNNIIKQIGSFLPTTCLNPLIITRKGASIICVLDARHPNSTQINLMNHFLLNLLLPNLHAQTENIICN